MQHSNSLGRFAEQSEMRAPSSQHEAEIFYHNRSLDDID